MPGKGKNNWRYHDVGPCCGKIGQVYNIPGTCAPLRGNGTEKTHLASLEGAADACLPIAMRKLTISVAMFNSKLLVTTRG